MSILIRLGKMNQKNKEKNRLEMINKITASIQEIIKKHNEIGGFRQNIIVADGGVEKFVHIPYLLNKNRIRYSVEMALEKAKGTSKGVYGISGFLIYFQFTLDKGRYFLLDDINLKNK